MFGRQRKSECHRIREMFSPYLDDCVTSVERDAVKYHIEICEDCEWELRSLGITVQLLSLMPAASVPRSFALAKAPRRYGIPLAIPSMNRLRMATALAVVLLAILLAGDFSGLFHGDVIVPVAEAAADRVSIDVTEPEEDIAPALPEEMPALVEEDPTEEIVVMTEAWEPVPSLHPPEQMAITQRIEPRTEEDLQVSEIPEAVAHPYVPIPEAPKPVREPYPWLLPLQIAAATLVLVLGGADVLVRKRKRAYTY